MTARSAAPNSMSPRRPTRSTVKMATKVKARSTLRISTLAILRLREVAQASARALLFEHRPGVGDDLVGVGGAAEAHEHLLRRPGSRLLDPPPRPLGRERATLCVAPNSYQNPHL